MATNTGTFLESNTTVLEANEFPIKSVKLFRSGGAEVTRVFPLSFLQSQDGPQIVEIDRLPAGLESVHVSVTSVSGNVTILDYYHFAGDIQDDSEKISSQKLRELQTERARLKDERGIRQQSFKFLTTYMDSLAQCRSQVQTEASQMLSLMGEFVEVGATCSAAIAELENKVADLDECITEERDHLSKLGQKLPVKVVSVLSCKSEAPAEVAELTVTYGEVIRVRPSEPPTELTVLLVVTKVSWKPEYDLRISMDGITPSPTVNLDFRCSVTQWTGENWGNISLTLTTADQASQLIQAPEPKRIDIRLSPVSIFPPMFSVPAVFGQPSSLGAQGLFGSALSAPVPPAPVTDKVPEVAPPPQIVSQLASHSGKDPITHIANGAIFIPSDSTAHHVLVTSLSLQAEFMRVVAPNIDTRVYYTCEIKNTSNYVLLPGTVKTYLNDKHVSSTNIHSTELPQTLECSLAIDTAVKTIHNHTPEIIPSAGEFSAKATTTYTSVTIIQNTHAEPIRGIVVRSAIPLPADPRVTIMLKEPLGLADINEGSVAVKQGCLARWSTKGGRKGKQAGLFEWVCDVDRETEIMVKAVWEVCAPRDLLISEQVHTS